MNRHLLLSIVIAPLVFTACAAGLSASRYAGTAGPVAWEIIDLAQSRAADDRAIRWNYTIVLKETTGVGIQFEAVEDTAYGEDLQPRPFRDQFRRRLDKSGELRFSGAYTVYYTGGYRPGPGRNPGYLGVTRLYRFLGKDDGGRAVSLEIRFPLDSRTGTAVKRPPLTASLPPPTPVRPEDLATLAGVWKGSHRTEYGIETPIELNLHDDGTFEVEEGRPIRNRYRGNATVNDGRLSLTMGTSTGTLVLHEARDKRILTGHFIVKRNPPSGQPGMPVTLDPLSVQLESSPALATPPGRAPQTRYPKP